MNITVDTQFRGAIAIDLVSPHGTRSRLQEYHHDRHADIKNWRYQSIFSWAETPVGSWKIEMSVQSTGKTAHWRAFHLLVHTHHKDDGGTPKDFHFFDPEDLMHQKR